MNYVPIRVSTLRGDQKIDFDAYLKIADKHILYLRKGDSFEGTRLDRLREKKLKKMFILPEHEESYRRYVTTNIEAAFDDKSGKPIETRSQVIQGHTQAQSEELFERPEDAQQYNSTKEIAQRFNEFLEKQQESFKHVINIENVDQSIAHHGVTVATLASMLAQRLGDIDAKSKQLLTLGCLVHDIEHHHSGVNIKRPLVAMSEQELKTYKEHPEAGARRLQDKKHFDQAVLMIISQHEEFIDGNGFPKNLREANLDPLSIIAGSANAVDRRMTFENVPKKEVGKQLMMTALGQRPLNHLQILAELVNSI